MILIPFSYYNYKLLIFIRFAFYIGDSVNHDPNYFSLKFISSEPSYIYCFYDSFSVNIYNKSYSKEVSSSEAFENPLTFKVNFFIYDKKIK